jgi:Na+/melibiose symporter-like transporter
VTGEENIMFEQLQNAFKNNAYRKAIFAVVLFIVVNALKTSLFNYFLIPEMTKDIFVYKFWYTLLLGIIVY